MSIDTAAQTVTVASLATETHPHVVVLHHEAGVTEAFRAYTDPSSARRAGRTAVRNDDALDFHIETVDVNAVIDDEHLAGDNPELDIPIDMTITTHFDMADEMTGTGSWADDTDEAPAPAPAAKFSRKVRVFLGKDVETKPFTHTVNGEEIEVRVITARRSDTATEVLGHADEVSIFGHRRGLIDTVDMTSAPEAVRAAFTALGLY